MSQPLIEIRTGSDSDMPKIVEAYNFLDVIGVPFSPRILSAHRTPGRMIEEARQLKDKGFLVSIAAAGGSAHLPGMTASETPIPVVGLPVKTSNLDGEDSLYSIIQMPPGIPVGCVDIGQARTAAILAAQIAYHDNPEVRNQIRKARGIDEQIRYVPINNSIGIIKLERTHHKRGYEALSESLQRFGLETLEVTLAHEEIRKPLQELEEKGVNALIVFGEFEETLSNEFPATVARNTDIPVIGVPIASTYAGKTDRRGNVFSRMFADSYTNCSKPEWMPVAGMGIGRFDNAVLYAAQIVGLRHPEVQDAFQKYRRELAQSVIVKDEKLQSEGLELYLTSMQKK